MDKQKVKEKTERVKQNNPILLWLFPIVAFCGALLFDIYPVSLIQVEKIEEIAIASIQIQATVSTLCLTLMTIFANESKAEEYGISVMSYILQKKMKLLSMKSTIVVELILIPVAVGVFCIGYYNVVFSLFCVSVYLILMMVSGVFGLHRNNRDSLKDEIYTNAIEASQNEKSVDLFYEFFLSHYDRMSRYEINDYCKKAVQLLEKRGGADKSRFFDYLQRMIHEMLGNEIKGIADEGVVLLEGFLQSKGYSPEDGFEFDISGQLDSVIINAFKYLSTDKAYDLYWSVTIKLLRKESLSDAVTCFMRRWPSIVEAVGYNLSKVNAQRDLFNEITTNQYPIYSLFPEGMNKLHEQVFLSTYVRYGIAILRNGAGDILFEKSIKKSIPRVITEGTRDMNYPLSLFTYLFYLAEFEREVEVLETEKTHCRLLIKKIWSEFVGVGRKRFIINEDSFKLVFSVLESRELFLERRAKSVIMESVVSRILVYTYVCLNPFRLQVSQFFDTFKYTDFQRLCFLFLANPNRTKAELFSFMKLTGYEEGKEEDIKRKSEELYATLDQALRNKHAKQSMERKKREYSELSTISSIEEELKKNTISLLNEKLAVFKNETSGDKEKKTTIQFHCQLMKQTVRLSFFNEHNPFDYLRDIIENHLIINIWCAISAVAETEMIIKGNGDGFDEFVTGASSNDSLIGFDVSIGRWNMNESTKVEQFIASKKALIGSFGHEYLFSFDSSLCSINYENLSVVIREYTWDEIRKEIQEQDDGTFEYYSEDVPVLGQKDEVLEFFKYSKRKIEASCDFTIDLFAEKFGIAARFMDDDLNLEIPIECGKK